LLAKDLKVFGEITYGTVPLAQLYAGEEVFWHLPPGGRFGELRGRHETVTAHSLGERFSPGCNIITSCFHHGAVAGFHFGGSGGCECFKCAFTDGVAQHFEGVSRNE
jgi:hypothetical protein